MPAFIGAGVAAAGGLASYLTAPDEGGVKKVGATQSAFQPLLLAFLQSGGDLSALQVKKNKKGGRKLIGPDGKPVSKAETVKLGGQRYLIGGAGRDIINQQFNAAQQEAIGQTQTNFDMLFGENGPQFLKDRISNRPQQIRDAFGPAVAKGLREAIGGAAPSGTLTTDAVLQRVSAPVAFQAEQFFQGAQDVANAQELGLAGVPGFGSGFSSNPNNLTQPQGLDYLQGLNFQRQGLNAGIGQFNSSLANQQQGFKSGLIGSTAGGIGGIFGNAAGF